MIINNNEFFIKINKYLNNKQANSEKTRQTPIIINN